MPINLEYATKEELPEAFRNDAVFNELFTTRDGKIVLSGVTGMKTQKDVDTLSEALRKERGDHGTLKEKLKPWGDRDPVATLAELDKIEEYKLAAEGKLDDTKINGIVESRLAQKTGPLERDLNAVKTENVALKTENQTLKERENTRVRNDQIRTAAVEAKVLPEAIDDILLIAGSMMELTDDGKVITKDGNGLIAGLDPKAFFQEMQNKRPYWWPASEGGGGRGSGGGGTFANNPWSAEHWSMTEQGKAINADRAKAEQMAKAAGSHIGATKPTAAKK